MEITKEEIINQFKVACDEIQNIRAREIAVGYQYTRYVWDLITKDKSLIRIENSPSEKNPKIMFFCSD